MSATDYNWHGTTRKNTDPREKGREHRRKAAGVGQRRGMLQSTKETVCAHHWVS
jgi:hypothetical protein